MTGHDPTVVAAYLLGALAEPERERVAAHLAGCAECRAELADLQRLPGLLARVGLDDLEPPPAGEALFRKVSAAVDRDRDRVRRRRRLAVASAAAAVIVAGGVAGGLAGSGGGTQPRVLRASSGPIRMTVTMWPRDAGTGLDVSVSGVPDEDRCRLIAVSRDGARQTAGRWTAGYAGTAHVTGLATSFPPGQLAAVVLLDNHGNRVVAALPLSPRST